MAPTFVFFLFICTFSTSYSFQTGDPRFDNHRFFDNGDECLKKTPIHILEEFKRGNVPSNNAKCFILCLAIGNGLVNDRLEVDRRRAEEIFDFNKLTPSLREGHEACLRLSHSERCEKAYTIFRCITELEH